MDTTQLDGVSYCEVEGDREADKDKIPTTQDIYNSRGDGEGDLFD